MVKVVSSRASSYAKRRLRRWGVWALRNIIGGNLLWMGV